MQQGAKRAAVPEMKETTTEEVSKVAMTDPKLLRCYLLALFEFFYLSD